MPLESYGNAKKHQSETNPDEVKPEIGSQLELTKSTSDHIVGELESLPDSIEYKDISKMYHDLPSGELIVRRENPEALMHTLTENDPLKIDFVGNIPYANSVAWNPKIDGPRGLDNAMLEGYGHSNNVVMVYGFEKPEDFYFEQHAESSQIFAGVDRLRVRTSAGFVPSEAIRFVTVRTPIQGFPENRMTEEEQDVFWEYMETEASKRKPTFIYRGFLFTKKEEAAHHKMAA
jgi:hypothetical protein